MDKRRRRGAMIAGVLILVIAITAVGGMAIAKKKKKTVKLNAGAMNGLVEVPQGDTDGTGTSKFKLTAKKKKVCFDIDFQNIQAPFVAHIHEGAEGVAGPIKILLFDTPEGATTPQSDCVKADKSLIKQIGKKPGSYYCNIHTDDFPAGAIRGQLQKGSGGSSGGGGGGGTGGGGFRY